MADRPANAAFARDLVTFGRILREGGVPVGPPRLLHALQALDVVGVRARDDVYWALRCTLVSDHGDIEPFDVAFAAFWERAADRGAAAPHEVTGSEGDELPASTPSARTVDRVTLGREEAGEDGPGDGGPQGTGWSAHERLQTLDFADYGADELRDAATVLAEIARELPRRRSRRLQPAASGRHLDSRRTLQQAMRTEGHPLQPAWSRHKQVPRKLVFLLDVSGSMRAYARPLLMFAGFMVRSAPRVEVFSFGTRLTHLTPHLSRLAPAEALRRTGRLIPDWSGGTRIGESLERFNAIAARTALTRGAAVVLLSDGWERGEVTLLREEMARLHRVSHSVLWVNPLAGAADYEPLVAGMAAALPSIDVFLPGHDLGSVAELARVLAALPRRRHGTRPARPLATGLRR